MVVLVNHIVIYRIIIFLAITIESDAIDLNKPSNAAYKDQLFSEKILFPLIIELRECEIGE